MKEIRKFKKLRKFKKQKFKLKIDSFVDIIEMNIVRDVSVLIIFENSLVFDSISVLNILVLIGDFMLKYIQGWKFGR